MKTLPVVAIALMLTPFSLLSAPEQEWLAVPDTYHVIAIKGESHNIQTGQLLQLDAVSNKGHEEYTWSVEDPSVANVTQQGLVEGLKAGTTLVIATSRKDQREGIYVLVVADVSKAAGQDGTAEAEPYRNKGILLFPADVESVPEWPRLAKEAGLNTIGLHPGGGHLEGIVENLRHWLDGPQGEQFLGECRKHGIEVEYEIHAIKELMPRELFRDDPSMFRSYGGKRHQQHNFCAHSYDALKTLSANVVEFSRHARPTTGRYYYWPDDGAPFCECFACKDYSNSEKALMMELFLQKELEKMDPRATVSHLAYSNTLVPPERIKPNGKTFLEFAAIARSYDKAYSTQKDAREGWRHLEANLKVFPAETAQILEYWVDVSKWASWKRPFTPLPWENMLSKVIDEDVRFYQSMGLRNFTSFGNGLDGYYREQYGFGDIITDYGRALNQEPKMPVYRSSTAPAGSINIDGILDEDVWESASWETGFTFPWQSREPPETAFCFVRLADSFYFAYRVQDADLVFASGPEEDEMGVAKGDRVEIFFSRDKDLEDYYCMEFSPKGRVLDYRASFYREFDTSWDCPNLRVATRLVRDGYLVEGAIPRQTLVSLGLLDSAMSKPILMGLFRAEFSHTAGGEIAENWISWVSPDAEIPDFHIPSAFGHLALPHAARE